MTKHNINDVRQILKELDEKYGINTSHLPVLHNKRLSRSLGRCHYVGRVPSKFDFSTLGLNLEPEAFKQLVMHEWAHAYNRVVYNGNGHDKTFKMTCEMIGCTNDGTKFADQQAIEVAKQTMPQNYKYAVVCKCCGTTSRFTRKTQVWKVISGEMFSINTYHCGKCKERNTLEAVVL